MHPMRGGLICPTRFDSRSEVIVELSPYEIHDAESDRWIPAWSVSGLEEMERLNKLAGRELYRVRVSA